MCVCGPGSKVQRDEGHSGEVNPIIIELSSSNNNIRTTLIGQCRGETCCELRTTTTSEESV